MIACWSSSAAQRAGTKLVDITFRVADADLDRVNLSVQVSDDQRTVEIELEELACYYIHDLQMSGLSAEDGSPLANNNVAYTVNRLLENGAAQLTWI